MAKTTRKSKRRNNNIYLFVLAIIGGGFFIYQNNISASVEIPHNPSVKKGLSTWESINSPFRKEIYTTINSGEIVFELSHAELVIYGKSINSGYDLEIYGQSDSISKELDFEIKDPDQVNTKIKFSANSMFNKYFLYFGNKTKNQSNLKTFLQDAKVNSSLGEEELTLVSIDLEKSWVLKEVGNDFLQVNINTPVKYEDTKIYAVINNNKEKESVPELRGSKLFIDLNKFETGQNSIYIYFNYNNKTYKSNILQFIYSAPIYVAWTIDWEGTAPDQKQIDSMVNVANDFSIPMTHFFNPRLYIYAKTTDQRKKELTDWMVKRINSGDDIALHMHMQHDLVEEAGVKAKYTEKSWDNGISGYDTPTTSYSYEEMKKIIGWGKQIIEDKFEKLSNFKIPELQGYRAGGWFANTETLKAIQENGFIYDSSGRVSFEIGKNKIKQPWDLFNTSQPYIPSLTDQNKTGQNNFELFEIPNNGADSYWSSAQEMSANFYANYTPGELIENDKLIVYLSHPDWFNIDDPKLRELFNEIGKYRSDRDLGPIKFITLREYLSKSLHIQQISKKD